MLLTAESGFEVSGREDERGTFSLDGYFPAIIERAILEVGVCESPSGDEEGGSDDIGRPIWSLLMYRRVSAVGEENEFVLEEL